MTESDDAPNAITLVLPSETTLGETEKASRARAHEYAAASKSSATKRAYRAQWRAFESWCSSAGRVSLPATPETVALYLVHMADVGRKPATMDLALVTISQAHKFAHLPSPRGDIAVTTVRAGIRRKHGTAQVQKRPLLAKDLKSALNKLDHAAAQGGLRRKGAGRRACGCPLRAAQDRALLLLGFTGAFRRSELVALDLEDLEFGDDGIVATIRRSKTDQEGQGRRVAIPRGTRDITCPVRAVRSWIDRAAIVSGPLFRGVENGAVNAARLNGCGVARAAKRAALLLGLDPKDFGGHSLRAGFATQAAKSGKTLDAIMKQTGHRSREVAARYVRDGELFAEESAAKNIGL